MEKDNEQFMTSLTELAKTWREHTAKLKELNMHRSALTKTIKECSTTMIHLMKTREITRCNISGGRLVHSHLKPREQLTSKRLLEILKKHVMLDNEKAQELTTFIINNRHFVETDTLKFVAKQQVVLETQTPVL